MILSFCGHGERNYSDQIRNELFNLLQKLAEEQSVLDCYCGGYGTFDRLCESCIRTLQKKYSNIRLVFISPYLSESYQKRLNEMKDSYDSIIFPPIEKVPPKYAILKRNEWIVNNSDLVIAYVEHSWGGAATTLQYAQRKKKKIINLYT